MRDFPAVDEYSRADESTYLRQGLAVRDGGLGALMRLGREYAADPRLHPFPNPLRPGHLAAAAGALAVEPSFRALSVLSTACFALLVLATFLCCRQVWGETPAAISAVLVAVSPIGAGVARRALMDSHVSLALGVSVLTFICWTHSGRHRDFAWFVAAAFWSMLVKETAFFFMPFFAVAALALRWRGVITGRQLTLMLVLPAAAAATLAGLYGGIDATVAIARAMQSQAYVPGSYGIVYGSGPWNQYLVESVLLSPASLLFFAFCGYWSLSSRLDWPTGLLIAFFWYGVACLEFFPKNVRYALPIDMPMRIGAALLMVELAARLSRSVRSVMWTWARRAVVPAILVTLIISDMATYHRLFIVDKTYDTIAYNLLVSSRMVPAAQPALIATPSPESLVELSAKAYREKDFAASIRLAQAAAALRPDYADADNNMGAAYNELQQWDEAIAALQKALQLRPDDPLARNNLAWAMASRK